MKNIGFRNESIITALIFFIPSKRMSEQPETLDNRLESIERRRIAERRVDASNARRRLNDIRISRNLTTDPEIYWNVMNPYNTVRLTDILNSQDASEMNIIYWPDYKVFGTLDQIYITFHLADISSINVGVLYTLSDGSFGRAQRTLQLTSDNIWRNSIHPSNDQQRRILLDVYSSNIPRYDRVVYLPQYRLRGTTREIYNIFRESGLESLEMGGVRMDLNEENIYHNAVQQNAVPEIVPVENKLFQESYETLLRQLYNLPITIPEFLIVNGLKVNFIPFSEIGTIQIDRYIIEPLLQPWAGPTNKILTIFGNNGMTYLVKAQYDPVNNQIFPPV